MWIDTIEPEFLKVILRHSPSQIIFATAGGKIVWASDEFQDWCGYSLSELKSKTVREITTHEERDEDVVESQPGDNYRSHIRWRTKLVPKNGGPVWGQLTVMRSPKTGDTMCAYFWEPADDGTQGAFQMAMDKFSVIEQRMSTMNAEIAKRNGQTDEEIAGAAIIRLAVKNPKWVIALILAISGSGPITAAVNYMLEKNRTENAQSQVDKPTVADGIAYATPAEMADYSVRLSTGTIINWSASNARGPRSLSVTAGRGGGGRIAIDDGIADVRGSSRGVDGMPDGTFWTSDPTRRTGADGGYQF